MNGSQKKSEIVIFAESKGGGVFCNAQTGNIVLLGMAVGNRNWRGVAYLLVLITAYGISAAVSGVLPDFVIP